MVKSFGVFCSAPGPADSDCWKCILNAGMRLSNSAFQPRQQEARFGVYEGRRGTTTLRRLHRASISVSRTCRLVVVKKVPSSSSDMGRRRTDEDAILRRQHDWLFLDALARLSGDTWQMRGMSPGRDENLALARIACLRRQEARGMTAGISRLSDMSSTTRPLFLKHQLSPMQIHCRVLSVSLVTLHKPEYHRSKER